MHEFILFTSLLVFLSCKSSQPFFKNIDPQWIVASNHYIYSKIKLKAIDEERIINIPTYHMFISLFKLTYIIYEINSSSSWKTVRFDNPEVRCVLFLCFPKVILELFKILRKAICLWHEVKLLHWESLLKFYYIRP